MPVLVYIWDSLLMTLKQLLIVLGPAMGLGLCMHFLASRIQMAMGTLVGTKVYIYATAPGTIAHELGHALFAKLFRHKIREMKLFSPSPDGTLGYVVHAWDRRSVYQTIGNFFIGTGPLWFGALLLWILSMLLVSPRVFDLMNSVPRQGGDITSWASLWDSISVLFSSAWVFLTGLFEMADFSSWTTYAFLYLVLAIGSHVSLSPPDIVGAAKGLAALAAGMGLLNLATLWTGDYALKGTIWLSQRLAVFYGIMLFVLILNAVVALVVVPLSRVIRR